MDERARAPLLQLRQRRVAECERQDDRRVRVVAVADPRMADCAEEPIRVAEREVLVGGQEARLPQELENVLHGGLLGGCSELRPVRAGQLTGGNPVYPRGYPKQRCWT